MGSGRKFPGVFGYFRAIPKFVSGKKYMTNMKKALILTVFLVTATVQGLQARGQKFTISGKIDGIEKGDTLRFRRITLPGWATGQAFRRGGIRPFFGHR